MPNTGWQDPNMIAAYIGTAAPAVVGPIGMNLYSANRVKQLESRMRPTFEATVLKGIEKLGKMSETTLSTRQLEQINEILESAVKQ
jgi:hypothetical protein